MLDLNKSAVLTDIRFQLVAKNSSNEFFLLDEFVFDLSSVVTQFGVQQINLNQSRGYILPTADTFGTAEIQLASSFPGGAVYSGTIGQKIKWQDWVQNANVDSIFYVVNKPNNNLNFKSSNYSNQLGYEIFMLAQTELT